MNTRNNICRSPGTMQSGPCRWRQASLAAHRKSTANMYTTAVNVKPNTAHAQRSSSRRATACSSSCSSSSSSRTSIVSASPAAGWFSGISMRCVFETQTYMRHLGQACRRSRSQHCRTVVAADASAPGQQQQQQQQQAAAAPQPDLSSIRKGGDIERLLFMQMATDGPRRNQRPSKPNAPTTPADFVEALEMVVRSSGQEINPDQLNEIFDEILSAQLLQQFSPAQLAITVKNLAILCDGVRGDFLAALIYHLQQQMAGFSLQQLSNVAWGLIRLVPVTQKEVRGLVGMDDQWLGTFTTAAEQQLQQVASAHSATQQQEQQQQQQQQQQQKGVPLLPTMPSVQQVANLLLLPAAAQLQLQPSLQDVLEQVVVLRQSSLCGNAVAQLLTCYVRLQLVPGPTLVESLLGHMTDELMLYDYDELTQVVFNAYVLQVEMPDTLLADITQWADALEAAGRAGESDKEVLREALQRLAARKAGTGPGA